MARIVVLRVIHVLVSRMAGLSPHHIIPHRLLSLIQSRRRHGKEQQCSDINEALDSEDGVENVNVGERACLFKASKHIVATVS
eukprot:10624306-Karenia_brevis.AAC.1